ncbi:MAG: hypothetical protein KBE03_08845 [Leptotrichiaceae bacterium]|nr:hypothetical protein [Leptotrichiaceae bacterium]
MKNLNVFIDKEEINRLFNEEKYKNCMDKKYFEYIVSNGKIKYIDKYLKNSKNKEIVESLVLKNKVIKVIDRLSVKVENKRYIGVLENLDIYDIEVSKEIVEKYHDQILTDGVFALITLEENTDKKYKYYIEQIEVLEDMDVNLEDYRSCFSERVKAYREHKYINNLVTRNQEDYISEIDLVLNTIGISTKELTFWEKILFLVRLIPLCEANYNLMELGGNGLGKTKTYSMFSPECEVVQEILTTDLIYNKLSKEKGLLDTKDVIVFDEINKIKLDGDKEKIIPQLLNFMADGQTTAPRKVISKTSLVFSGNVMGIQERLEKNEKNVFDNAHKFEDNAFLDRIHFFLPAWGLRRYSKNIHGLNMQKKVFRFDYFSKALSLLRDEDYSKILDEKGYVLRNGSEREIRAIRKTVSGLIKLTHPDKEIDDFTLEAYIAIAIKGRGLVNKFLNNKNKNNVDVIDIKVNRILMCADRLNREFQIPVNELLKRMIYENNYNEMKNYLDSTAKKYSEAFNFYDSYSYDKYIKIFEYNPYQNLNFQKKKFYEGKYYPNRHIIPISNTSGTHVFFIKIALDRMGIEKNKREYKKIIDENKSNVTANPNSFINVELKGVDGEILLVEFVNQQIQNNIMPYAVESLIFQLNNQVELNYDALFSENALDSNNYFTNLIIRGKMFELDISNVFPMDTVKKIWCEELKQEIIPTYRYNNRTDNYHYEYKESLYNSEPDNSKPYKSKFMNYVEFKYFLRDNGIIKF